MKKSFLPLGLAASLIILTGCGAQDRCAQVQDLLANCSPGQAVDTQCSSEMLSYFEGQDLDTMTCEMLNVSSKADWGCGQGRTLCGVFKCCNKYPIEEWPEDPEWDIVEVIDAYQAATPDEIKRKIEQVSDKELEAISFSETFQQEVVDLPGQDPKRLAVEISLGLIDLPYKDFIKRLRPADWGVELAQHLGGQREVLEQESYTEDGVELSRPTRQVERMVLSPLPIKVECELSNQDMTKTEVIFYEEDRAKVYWRVYNSVDESTDTDVGTVEFRALAGKTLVTFHSAHRLRWPAILTKEKGDFMDLGITEAMLGGFFLKHIRRYRDLVLD